MQSGKSAYITNIQKFSLHDGPGIRTTVFLKGCPLRCAWCSNPETQNFEPQMLGDEIDSKIYDIDEVLRICLQDSVFYEESGGGVTISGGEPLASPEFLANLITSLNKNKIHTAIETTGYAPQDVFLKIGALADLLLFDIKHYDSQKHIKSTGVDNSIIINNLALSKSLDCEILVRIPVIPGYNDSLFDAAEFAKMLTSLDIHKVQLLPFHQFGDSKYERLGLTYEFENTKSLYPEDLVDYQNKFLELGIDAFF